MTGVTVKPHIPLQTINTNVQVAVRLRPLLETDSRRSGQNGARPVVEIKYKPEDNKTNNNQCGDLFIHTATSTATVADNGRQGVVWIDQKRAFGFDKVFDEFTTQEQLFAGCGRQLAQDFVDGCNVTLFAYGQTGSGKTFSLMQHAAVRESAAAAEDNLEDGKNSFYCREI